MKKYLFCLFMFFMSFAVLGASSNRDSWNTDKSTHFIVYYKNAPEDFIKKLTDKSEEYYSNIASELGFTRYNFWLWDNRAKIYIYDDLKDYQSATNQPGWSSGCTVPRDKIIQTFPYEKGFFETILPHEMGHIIFREFVGFDNPAVPLWLDEGVASFQEKLKYSMANLVIRKAIKEGSFIRLEDLSNFNSHVRMSSGDVQIFYAEAYSIVDFLIKEFGQDNFVIFCQKLRDKRDLKRAVASSFSFSNIKELGDAWLKHLTAK